MKVPRRVRRVLYLAAGALAAAGGCGGETPAKDALARGFEIPYEVAIDAVAQNGTPEEQRRFFDDFAWRSFIALNWPALLDSGGVPVRGSPDTQRSVVNVDGPRVWESWKAAWELFKPKGAEPTEWGKYDPVPGACAKDFSPKAKFLVMASKVGSLLDPNDLNQAFSGPLIDQQRNYVRYEIRLNQSEYEEIRNKNWYKSLPDEVSFESTSLLPKPHYGAIEIKACWKELTPMDDASRYYLSESYVLEPGTPQECRKAKMGLVGFHIAHKIDPFREWVWATFEHVDNVPGDSPPAAGRKYSFNNGTDVPKTTDGFEYTPTPGKRPASLKPDKALPPAGDPLRTPVQVTRFTAVPAATKEVNARYQKLLSTSPWANYLLVSTQWPTVRGGAEFKVNKTFPKDCDTPFPPNHVANTTAETYFQNRGATSCMECHYQTSNSDFSWMLAIRSLGEESGVQMLDFTLTRRGSALMRLKRILEKDQK